MYARPDGCGRDGGSVRVVLEFDDGRLEEFCAIDPRELRGWAHDLLNAAYEAEDHEFLMQFLSRA